MCKGWSVKDQQQLGAIANAHRGKHLPADTENFGVWDLFAISEEPEIRNVPLTEGNPNDLVLLQRPPRQVATNRP